MKETDNIKIFVSYHKKGYVPNRDYIYPIQVGAATAKEHFDGMLHDDDGENISGKNKMYCELTAQYWAWKNTDADYYGFFHYRRYMNFSGHKFKHNPFQDVEIEYLNDKSLDRIGIDKIRMKSFINQYDVIATSEVNLLNLPGLTSNYQQYNITPYQYKEDLDVMLDIIDEKYPDFSHVAREYLHSHNGYFCNMFIMRKELFHQYCEWMFDILSEHEKRRDYSSYGPDALRISGYLGERLFGIYFTNLKKQKKYRLTELQRTLFKHTDVTPDLIPAFKSNNIAIALAANNAFMPYTAVTIQSIIENSRDDKNYDIIILTEDVKQREQEAVLRQIINKPNFSIRFLNPGSLLSGYKLYVRGHFSKETYYRLVLPDILPHYDKIAYLDSDLVVLKDVSELFATDLAGYLVAACNDADTAGLYNGSEQNKKKYTDSVLKLKKPYNYFQAGVLLLNLDEFRKTYSTEKILDYANSYNFELLDQDILNVLCEDKVKYLDINWNIMVDYENRRIKENIRNAPVWLFEMYMEGRRDPYIVHYAGPEKPWTSPEMDMAYYFWKYARQTEFYEWLISRLAHSAGAFQAYRMFNNTPLREKMNEGLNSLKDLSSRVLPYDSKSREAVKNIYHMIKK